MIAASVPVLAQTATGDQGTNGPTSAAPQGKAGHDRHGNHFQKMAQELNLSQQQQDQLKPMFEKQREQAKAIWQDNSLAQDQKKQKLQALHQDFQSQVNGVLTPAQQQQMAQMHKEHMTEGRQHFGERMAQKLNLSQQQQDQLKPILEKQREQAKAIWQDNSLTQEQKKEKMQAIRKDTQAQLNTILTPEQQQQWQQMRENMKQHRHGNGGSVEQPQPVPQA
jgi:Spy/CpxP family protein refolding chaperone